jgi:broad specificity phosphatase PhoE
MSGGAILITYHSKTMIYLIRHGQAGSRDNYDVLSDLGRTQAELLGEHLACGLPEVTAVYSGTMRRQLHTAEIVCGVMSASGVRIPVTIPDEKWNEISLAAMYRAMAPRMRAVDPGFDRDLDEMQALIQQDPHSVRGATGRCDAAVMRAWMANRYPDFEGESWAAFRSRIKGRITALNDNGHESVVIVFTSATPIATLVGHTLDLDDERVLRFAGVIYNTSITVIGSRAGEPRLVTFNSAPHLTDTIKTFR